MIFDPALTGSGASDFVTARSARVWTVVVAVPVLLTADGSVLPPAATALFVIVIRGFHQERPKHHF